jgi:outer membrane beta-barrel protein
MNRLLASLFVSALIAAPSFVYAQEEPTDEPVAETPAGEAAPAPTEESAPADGAAPAPVDAGKGPFPRISDDQETIYAVQRKAYLVNRRFEVTLMGSASFTDRFVQSFGIAPAVTYHIAENFGLQLFGVYLFPNESGLRTELLMKGRLTPEVAKLTQMLWGAGIGAEWSPIYGKLELFGASLGNFNFFVNVGAGVGQTRVECVPGLELDTNVHGAGATCPEGDNNDPFAVIYEPSKLQFMTALGGGVRFYFTNELGLIVEVKDWLFPARVYRPGNAADPTQRFTDSVRNNILMQIGVSYLFGGEE